MLYPITVEVLHQVFSPHGYVEKIVTFQKSAGFQSLIQFQLRQSAVAARNSLQGRNIYDGCCQLDIQFSNLEELQVNYNNERSRDFTNPSLPSEQKGRPSQAGYGEAGGMCTLQATRQPHTHTHLPLCSIFSCFYYFSDLYLFYFIFFLLVCLSVGYPQVGPLFPLTRVYQVKRELFVGIELNIFNYVRLPMMQFIIVGS
ncbi:hypothetical protein R6Q59_020110 [Mikania micrantha]